MGVYVLRRLLIAVPTLFFITLIIFCVTRLAPGDPTELGGGEGAKLDLRTIEMTRKQFNLDKPLHVQYGLWLRDLSRLDFGKSFQDRRPVLEKVAEALRVTLFLSVTSLTLVYLIAVPIGITCAVRRNSFVDRSLSAAVFVLYSLPSFWVATMFIVYFGGGRYFRLFPIAWLSTPGAESWPFDRWLLDRLWHLVLPVTCLTYGSLAGLSRYARTAMLDVIRQDYIRTARAKGLTEMTVVFKHAARNGLIPILTLLAHVLPGLIGGAVIIETIFSIPGMGLLGFNAILTRDYPVVQAVLTFSAALTLLGFLLSDILYVIVDPRISFESVKR